ncbi:MAG: DUF106 domain-containing protein [Thermococci archaeon]|nr:DUF106 domain-containing protein [Thermococci archaeon]
MLEGVYSFLDKLFGGYIVQHPLLSITVAGLVVGAFFTLMYYFVMDIEKMKQLQKLSKELQTEMRTIQKELREAQMELTRAEKSGDKENLKKAQQRFKKAQQKQKKAQMKQMELMKMQGAVMKSQMIPMLLTMPIFWIFFGWLKRWYAEVAIVVSPKNCFLINWVFDMFHKWSHSALHPNQLGYFGWYILSSYVIGMILRKILDMP